MAIFAMWVDGITVVPTRVGPGNLRLVRLPTGGEVPWSDIHGLRDLRGTTFRGEPNAHQYFHFCIPTPVIVPLWDDARRIFFDRRISFDVAFLRFETSGARIDGLHVLDGDTTVKNFTTRVPGQTSLSLRGNHRQFGDPDTRFVIRTDTGARIPVNFGVKLSFNVTFEEVENAYITFVSAGVDFFVI